MSSNQKFNITSKCLITTFLKGQLATLISHKLQWLDFELEIVSNQEGSYFVTVTVATVLRRKPLFPLKFLNGTSLTSLKLKVVSTETISEDRARISATSFIEDMYRIIMYTTLASLLSDGQWLKIGSRRNNFLISISTGYYEMNRYLYFSLPLCMNSNTITASVRFHLWPLLITRRNNVLNSQITLVKLVVTDKTKKRLDMQHFFY